MYRPHALAVVPTICALVVLSGCMPKMTIEQMKAEMPKRPAELDRLNAFVGTWDFEGTATMAMLDEPLKSSGWATTEWDGDNWYLVSRGVYSLEGLGEMKAIETWTYDAHSKKYRSTWTDSMGAVGTGQSWYDEKNGTWHMRATSHGAYGKTTMKGSVKLIDDNTMEWTWTEYMGLMKTMEMTGTSKRRQ